MAGSPAASSTSNGWKTVDGLLRWSDGSQPGTQTSLLGGVSRVCWPWSGLRVLRLVTH